MLGVISEGKILAKILLILVARGPLFMYSRSLLAYLGDLFLCFIGISWMAKVIEMTSAKTTKRATLFIKSNYNSYQLLTI